MVISMERWVGKIAIVTGASVGIGAAIAEHLVNAGLMVVGLARRREKIEDLSQKLSNKKGKLFALKCDVSKEEDILNAFKWINDNIGHVQILVNNAGILQNTNLIEGDTSKWKELFDVNVFGLCIATREAIKIMREHNIEGHIINVNSISGHIVDYRPHSNVYSASKFAVTALTETFNKELQFYNIKNIKLTSISPGVVVSEIRNKLGITLPTDYPRLLVDDVADAVIYCLSTAPSVQVKELIIQPLHEEF